MGLSKFLSNGVLEQIFFLGHLMGGGLTGILRRIKKAEVARFFFAMGEVLSRTFEN